MRKLTLLISFNLLMFNGLLMAQPVAKGFVFADENANNRFDRKEKGIAGVAISNGTDVVQTAADGSYTLPAGADNIFFVIKPAGYRVPVNGLNQPQFYYIHKPSGSPALQYKGVEPTRKLPDRINFPLIPAVQNDEFRMLVFGDPQPYDTTEVDYFYRGLVRELEGVEGVEFGLSLGDLVGDNLDLFMPYKKAVSHVGIPWYNVMGNHDENYDVKHDSLSDESFERHFGPATYAFNHGKVHFIVLDDILYPDPRGGDGYWGGFREDQFRFMENDLKFVPKDHLIVLAFHIPISEREGWGAFRGPDRDRLFRLLQNFPYTLSMSAHTHFQSQDFFTRKEGWLQDKPHHHFNVAASCGDWYSGPLDAQGVPMATMRDGTRKGYVFLNFSGNRFTFDYKVAGEPADYQFELYVPKTVKATRYSSAQFAANFFIGAKTDSVFFRVDGGAWKPMRYTEAFDPSYMKLLYEYDFSENPPSGRRPSNPDLCNHLWVARVPVKLEPGMHEIELKGIDMFGREHRQKQSYRLMPE